MNSFRPLAAALALVLAGCVSSTTMESRVQTDNMPTDARRKAEAHTLLAGEYYSRGSYGIALQETKLAIQTYPSLVDAWNVQGLIHMELREDVLARESFERALRMEPNNAEVLNNYGWFFCLRGDNNRGIEMITRASNDPLYPSPEKAYLSAGLCQRRAGRPAEAEQLLRRAVSIRPDMIGALYNLAELTFERGAAKDANVFITRYMRITQQPAPEALLLGVRVARANGDKVAEEGYMQQMRRRYPDAPETKQATGS